MIKFIAALALAIALGNALAASIDLDFATPNHAEHAMIIALETN